MDDETRAYLDRMMVQINNQFERLLDESKMFRTDLLNTKSFLIRDSLLNGDRLSSLENRIETIEHKLQERKD